MSKYLFLYRGPATDMSEFTPEQGAEQMAVWGKWMGTVGPSLADPGAPFASRTSVADDGSTAAPGDLNGYSIIEAPALDKATKLAKGCPILKSGGQIAVYETFNAM